MLSCRTGVNRDVIRTVRNGPCRPVSVLTGEGNTLLRTGFLVSFYSVDRALSSIRFPGEEFGRFIRRSVSKCTILELLSSSKK